MAANDVVVRRRRDGRHVADTADVALSPMVAVSRVPTTLRRVGIAMLGLFYTDLDLLRRHGAAAETWERVNAAEWGRWLSETNHGWPTSFVNCALYVGQDPVCLRRRLQREVVESGVPRRQIMRYGSAA